MCIALMLFLCERACNHNSVRLRCKDHTEIKKIQKFNLVEVIEKKTESQPGNNRNSNSRQR